MTSLSLGPVFKFECLATSRRRQHFVGRVLFIGFLLAALVMVAERAARPFGPIGLREMAKIGEEFYLAIMGTQISLLFLAAPAVAADAICIDKSRGALLPLLTTDLSSSEIILGKLFARLLAVFVFVLCSLPVLAICFTMGGIHPEVVFGAYLVCFGIALVGVAAALTLSVWCSKTYEVLLVCYLGWIALLMLQPVSWILPAWVPTGWLRYCNPYSLCLGPYLWPGSIQFADFALFFAGCSMLSVVFVVVAVFGLRRVILMSGAVPTKKRRQRAGSGRGRWRLPGLPGPTLDGNPILWREWHRHRPSRWVRAVWWLYGLGSLGFSIYAFMLCVTSTGFGWEQRLGILVNAFQVGIGLLLVSVTSVTSLQDERMRGSLDVILTTPLSTLAVFWGKWWGSFRVVLWLTVLPTFVASGHFVRETMVQAIVPAFMQGKSSYFLLMPIFVCCFGAAVVSVGLALAVWIRGPGRAMATSVVIYIGVTAGTFFIALFVTRTEDSYFASASCFMASAMLTHQCLDIPNALRPPVPMIMSWSVNYVIGAAILGTLACRSFNRCLGRMPETMPGRFKLDRGAMKAQRREQMTPPRSPSPH